MKRWEGKVRNGCRDKQNGESKYKIWRTDVFERDNWICQCCLEKTSRIHAHHIKHWATHPELRYDIDNGITLCPVCHSEKHPKNKALIMA